MISREIVLAAIQATPSALESVLSVEVLNPTAELSLAATVSNVLQDTSLLLANVDK